MSTRKKAKRGRAAAATSQQLVYIVRWTRSTTVDDFCHEHLYNIETCGDDIEEAKEHVCSVYEGYEGLADDGGTVGVFSSMDVATEAVEACLRSHARGAREALKELLDCDDDHLAHLLEGEELTEETSSSKLSSELNATLLPEDRGSSSYAVHWGPPDAEPVDCDGELFAAIECATTQVNVEIETCPVQDRVAKDPNDAPMISRP